VADAVAITRGTRTRVIVNDRLDVALACGADGVQLRGDSMPAARARSIAPAGFLIGQSVHSVEEAVRVAADADYVIAGTVFPTPSKADNDQFLGAGGLAAIVAAVRIPVLAIGGVTVDRMRPVARSGAAGIAAIGLFAATDRRLADVVADMRRIWDEQLAIRGKGP
jgi:thiamine-phosphate pyrophosphorylase